MLQILFFCNILKNYYLIIIIWLLIIVSDVAILVTIKVILKNIYYEKYHVRL